MTTTNDPSTVNSAELDRLVGELEKAEAYEQKLRQLVIDVRDQLASGHVEAALSMLNGALNLIDDQTDVVAPTNKGPG